LPNGLGIGRPCTGAPITGAGIGIGIGTVIWPRAVEELSSRGRTAKIRVTGFEDSGLADNSCGVAALNDWATALAVVKAKLSPTPVANKRRMVWSS